MRIDKSRLRKGLIAYREAVFSSVKLVVDMLKVKGGQSVYVTDINKVKFYCDKCKSKRLKYTEKRYDKVRRIRVECLDCGEVYEFNLPEAVFNVLMSGDMENEQ